MEQMKRDLDRPTPFTMRGVRVTMARKSIKGMASVYIEQTRLEYLRFQISGGVRRPRRKVLVIGTGRRNKHGNTPRQSTLATRLLLKADHFEATINGTSGIWRRRRGGSRRVSLVALYTSQARYSAGRYKFVEAVELSVRRTFGKNFDRAITRALQTSRRRGSSLGGGARR